MVHIEPLSAQKFSGIAEILCANLSEARSPSTSRVGTLTAKKTHRHVPRQVRRSSDVRSCTAPSPADPRLNPQNPIPLGTAPGQAWSLSYACSRTLCVPFGGPHAQVTHTPIGILQTPCKHAAAPTTRTPGIQQQPCDPDIEGSRTPSMERLLCTPAPRPPASQSQP